MRQFLLRTALGLAVAAAAAAWLGPYDAGAVVPAQVTGAYRLKMKGDGWIRTKTAPYRMERLSGNAALLLARDTTDAAKVKVEIRLDPTLDNGLIDLATGEPAFTGSGYIVGDSLAIIDTATPTFSNALTLTFLKDGGKIAGNWMAVFPATDPASSAASAFAIEFEGKKLVLRSFDGR